MAFAALAVADRVLLMELISTNYLGLLVTELRDIVGGARYGHFESTMVGVTKVLPKRYFFGVVVPVVVVPPLVPARVSRHALSSHRDRRVLRLPLCPLWPRMGRGGIFHLSNGKFTSRSAGGAQTPPRPPAPTRRISAPKWCLLQPRGRRGVSRA